MNRLILQKGRGMFHAKALVRLPSEKRDTGRLIVHFNYQDVNLQNRTDQRGHDRRWVNQHWS